jgi:hypothetical protein
MKRIYFLVLLISSCTHTKKNIVTNSNIQKLKSLAYCKCLEYSISNFVGKDTNDISGALLTESMDFYGGYFFRNFYPIIDSSAYTVYLKQKRRQFEPYPVAEGSGGKVAYKLECLDFYQSKELDNITKIIAKGINDSIYIDNFYKKK